MNLTRRRGAVLGASLVLALPLAGCSEGDAEPKMAPTQSVASTPSGEQSGSPSSEPALTPREQQEDFLALFVEKISQSLSDGDSSVFMTLSSPDCQNCKVLAKNLADAYAGGGSIEGGHWALKSSRYVEHQELGHIWNVDVQTRRERWLDGTGKVVQDIAPGIRRFGVALQRRGGQWLVREMRSRA